MNPTQPHNAAPQQGHYSYEPTIDAFLASLLMGAGVYGGGQLANHALGLHKKKDEEQELKSGIPIHVPKAPQHNPEQHVAEKLGNEQPLHPDLLRALAIAGGGAGGFLGAKGIYDAYQGMTLNHQLNKQKKKYEETLNASKMAEENTPLVDAFCEGMAKIANSSQENALMFGSPMVNALGGVKDIGHAATGGDGGFLDTYGKGLLGVGGVGALGLWHIMNQMNQKKREANKDLQIPNVYMKQ